MSGHFVLPVRRETGVRRRGPDANPHRQVGPVPGGGAGTPPDPLAVTAWPARWRSAGHPCA